MNDEDARYMTDDDAHRFFTGCVNGVLLSIPLWVVIIWAARKLWTFVS